MPHRTLADFLEDLGRAGELAAVDAEVDPCLEIAEVTRRIARQNGPALLFRNVRGHDIPLLTNLFGTESRILRALGAESIEEATERIDRALNSGGGEGWLERLRFGGKSGAAASFAANRVKSGACQQVVCIGSDVNLLELPLLSWGKLPTTPAIPALAMFSADPESHAQVLLRGDLQITGPDTTVAAWLDVADPSRLANAYCKLGRNMPVAVVVGGDPAVQLAAAAPLPSVVDPLGLMGLLRQKPLEAVACRTVDLLVPAESDFVIEGHITQLASDGFARPGLSPDGHILGSRAGHLMRITAVTHRANSILSAVVPGEGAKEFGLRDQTMARVFLPYLKTRVPELVDFNLPLSACARHVAILAIEKTYSGQAQHVAATTWTMRPFQFARLLIIVDVDVDVHELDEVLAAIALEATCTDNIWEHSGPRDPLAPKLPLGQLGRRLVIDATRDRPGEFRAKQIGRLRPDKAIMKLVAERWAEYGLGPEPQP